MRETLNTLRSLPADEMAVLCMLIAAAALLLLCGMALAMSWRDRRKLAVLRETAAADHEQIAATRHSLADLLERLERTLAEVEAGDHGDHDLAAAVHETPQVEVKTRAVLPRRDSTLDPLTQGVYDLADQGYAPVQIAQELSEHIGKVELILALRAI